MFFKHQYNYNFIVDIKCPKFQSKNCKLGKQKLKIIHLKLLYYVFIIQKHLISKKVDRN